jgi:hypothetical protein
MRKIRLSTSVLAIALALLTVATLLGLLTDRASAQLPPPVTFSPSPNSHTAPATTTLVVSFAWPIDPASVSTRTLAVHSHLQGHLTGVYTVAGAQVEIQPPRPYFPGELVELTVTTHTHSLSDTALITPLVGQFRTAVPSGSGTFASSQTPLDSQWSEDVALGDLDGDGDLDFFVGHRDDASTIWFNDGAGHFTTDGIDLGSDFVDDVALGDLDGDGDLDALLAGIQDNSSWFNDGQGAFTAGGEIFPSYPAIIHQVALGDLDGDGDLDAATATSCDPFDPNPLCDYSTNSIWWNDGHGTLLPSTQSLGLGTTTGLALGDLDGDGDLDALVVRNHAPGGTVWHNLGHGVFTHTQFLDALFATSAELGDLDGDGDLDAFVGAQTGAYSAVWRNDGAGHLQAGQKMGKLGEVVLGDLDGDGDLDAFSIDDGAPKVWLNQGDATFVFSGQPFSRTQGSGVALGDVDGDGDLDAVASAYGTGPVLWVNRVVSDRHSSVWIPSTPSDQVAE